MGLEPFRQTEIRSAVMGIPITITEEVIAKACRVASSRRFLWNVYRNHPLLDSFKGTVLKGNSSTKLVDIDGHHRMLLKFMTECFFQKGGGSDQPSVDHKLVLYFLAAYDKINLPKYIMHHLCWAVKEGIRGKRKQIPCGRLLSEIFTQGKLLETLSRYELASDKTLRTTTGKIINGKTLQNMKIIKKFSPNEKDLKESAVQSALMNDFPPIIKERNPEVLAKLIAAFVKESEDIILDDETSGIPDDTPLRVRGKRAKSVEGSEAAGVQTKKAKKDKSEASDNISASAPKRKRRKGESSLSEDVEVERTKKKQSAAKQYESPMFVMTPAMTKMAQEYTDKMIADKKQQKIDYLAARDAKLKELGLDKCDEYYVQKLA